MARLGFDPGPDVLRRALADLARRLAVGGGKVDAAHAGLGSEGHEHGVRRGQFAGPQIEFLLCEDDNRPALGRLVGQRGKLRGIGQAGERHPGCGYEFGRHAVAERDGSSLVEQEHVDVAGSFDGPT